MIILIFYIIFAVISIIIYLILAYIDYNNGEAITLEIIGIALLLIALSLSILGILYFTV